MPTKMASCCKEKAVLISVYVEKPQRRKISLPDPSHRPHHHRHHYRHHHLHLHHPNGERQIQSHSTFSGKGYNRRAELLHYSQHLRESAQPAAESTSLLPAPISTNNHRISDKTVTVQRKRKVEMAPFCLGNYKTSIKRFLQSLKSFQAKKDSKKRKKNSRGSTGNKGQSVTKSLEVPKKWAFWANMLSALRKQR
ncbi:SKI/DACH domain-containing protein 1-like [Eucalyptus grandis]|uniref:SKI/DACH domain-containing protein 1-like n=1 Tax=Eucalyptus grandis TaxID=71139 RepID=UPI00192EEE63|nr:SKI/DACH domain-containing protein 1-like [Eucalyptus grandis]